MGGMYFSMKRRMDGGSRLEKRAKGKSLVAKMTKAAMRVAMRALFRGRAMLGLLGNRWISSYEHKDGNTCGKGS